MLADEAGSGGGTEAGSGSASRRDVVGGFRRLPAQEKLLAAAAAIALLAFLIRGEWSGLFHRWFDTLTLLGAAAVVLLTLLPLLGVRFLSRRLQTYVLMGCAAVPAVGFVFDALNDVWGALMLAAAVVMCYAGFRIALREDLI